MNVLVTGGGTSAAIDDVRRITNQSTGRFSAMITEACLARGSEVWHLHSAEAELPLLRQARFHLDAVPTQENERLERLRTIWRAVRPRLHRVPLERGTVGEYAGMLNGLLQSQPIDIAFLAMAVSDYEPEAQPGKLDSTAETLRIDLKRTPKVIASVRDEAPGVYLVGFKLLSGSTPEELIERARESAIANRADLVVANDYATIREGRHMVHLVSPDPNQTPITLGPGEDMADQLVDHVFQLATRRMSMRDAIPLDDDPPALDGFSGNGRS